MKKTMIIALLAVLVLGAFTACNGEVNAELAGSRTITLEIVDSNNWKFDNEKTSLVVAIPEGCETWGDLVGKISITITKENTTKTLPLILEGSNVRFCVDDSGSHCSYYGHVNPNAKGFPDVQNNTSIALGKTYEIYIHIASWS